LWRRHPLNFEEKKEKEDRGEWGFKEKERRKWGEIFNVVVGGSSRVRCSLACAPLPPFTTFSFFLEGRLTSYIF
jgi:hypothetical protein